MIMKTETVIDNPTKVALINSGEMKYPMNLFIPIAEKRFPNDMEYSLANFKNIIESDNEQ